nr:ATP-binding protein [Corynebacterium ulceribovis]
MLLSLSIQNFRSFGDETTLDLQRRSFKTQRPREGETWTENTWRRAAIFGANAAGKSNVLRALSQLNLSVKNSLTDERFVRRLRDPHLLRTDRPTSFELEYVNIDVRYRWGVTVDKQGVVEEYLEANPKSRWRLIFERDRDTVVFGPGSGLSHAAKENIEQFMRPWALVLSAWGTVKTPGKNAGALHWWTKLLPLIVTDSADQDNRHQWLVDLAKKDPSWLNVLRMVVSVADVGIDDIGIEEKAPEAIKSLNLIIQPDGKAEISQEVEADLIIEYLHYILFVHKSGDREFSLPEEQESQGTRTWMDLAVPAIFALAVGGVMSVDEIDGSLHPMLVRELVSYFDTPDLNPHGAQLLFTTHDLTLLGRHPVESLHRGEVWFVDKDESFSELVALDEFPVREVHNIEKRYMQGVYGAVPVANQRELLATVNVLRAKYLGDQAQN